MATRLRRFSTNSATKFFAFMLIVIMLTAIAVQVVYLAYQILQPEAAFIEHYQDSMAYYEEVRYDLYHISRLAGQEELPEEKLNYYYFFNDGVKQYTNVPEAIPAEVPETVPDAGRGFFAQHDPAFFAFEDGQLTMGVKTRESDISSRISTFRTKEEYTIYLAYPTEYLAAREQEWQESRDILQPKLLAIVTCSVIALILLIFLFSVTGRKAEDRELHPSLVDNIYSDFLILALIPIGLIWLSGMSELVGSWTTRIAGALDIYQIYSLIGVGALTAVVSSLCGVILLSLARKIKGRRLLRHSLGFTICFRIYDFFKSFIDGRRYSNNTLTRILFLRQRNFIIASAVLVFFTFLFFFVPPLFLLPIILELMVIYWYIKSNNETFLLINQGFNESLEEQMRAERHKIALVTNVSHDLKTPLTSIISYVDLLAKEEDLSETARDYVTILAEKSDRLKNIVADLFDLAKSTSGDIALELESLDLKKLIEQTLGDMEDKVSESGLQVRSKLPEDPVYVYSDGKKLYRVFQNIIDNALQYSLQGTRVYIDLEESGGKAIATVKNTAGYEMDFTAEEILQRFSRGDKSRATEGSGLGLSIAESFTNVCGGDFKVDVDGDLFKVTISFKIQ